ncbi:PepSY domain-containing protein [Streptomyces sp. NPDC059917]|uniref:PepSY domain-containing protein n=1 Tax=Streptomyces sp. NPDC059917 TaxID=3347002 RepID=UPI00364EDA11
MKRNVFVSSAAAVVLVAGGPVAAAAASTAGDAARAPTAVTAVPADVSAETAAGAALKKFPGVVESLDLDGSVWHVDVIGKGGKHAELEVDASSGAVTQRNSDDNDDDNGNEYAPLIAAKVTAVQALKAAVAAHPGQVRSVSWDDDDNDNGKTSRYWNVEVKTSGGQTRNVHVDPASGKATLSHDSDDNDSDSSNDSNSDGGGN